MATASVSEIEAQHRTKLDDIKHRHNMAKRCHQVERMGVRIDLLLHRAAQLPAETKTDLAAKLATFEREVTAVKAVAGQTAKEHREAANAAWKNLRDAFNAAYEEAGLAQDKATQSASETEAQHRAKLADVKHRHYVAKRDHQVERMGARVDLLLHRAAQLPAETKADLAAKLSTFSREVTAVKSVAGQTAKAHREAANVAWNDLRDAFNAAYEQAGLAQAKPKK